MFPQQGYLMWNKLKVNIPGWIWTGGVGVVFGVSSRMVIVVDGILPIVPSVGLDIAIMEVISPFTVIPACQTTTMSKKLTLGGKVIWLKLSDSGPVVIVSVIKEEKSTS